MTTLDPGQFAKHAGLWDKLKSLIAKSMGDDQFQASLRRSLERERPKSIDGLHEAIFRQPRPHPSVAHIAEQVDALPTKAHRTGDIALPVDPYDKAPGKLYGDFSIRARPTISDVHTQQLEAFRTNRTQDLRPTQEIAEERVARELGASPADLAADLRAFKELQKMRSKGQRSHYEKFPKSIDELLAEL